MKKSILTTLLIFTLVLGLFAGCAVSDPADTYVPAETTAPLEENETAGILVVNAGAPVEVMYDKDGSVLQVIGYGEKGLALAEDFTHVRGAECKEIIEQIVAAATEKEYVSEAGNYIVLRLVIDSALPYKLFTDDAVIAAYNANKDAKILLVNTEELDSNGYIAPERAAQLLNEYLSLEDPNGIKGRYTVHAGVYYFSTEVAGANVYYTVDAYDGTVTPCSSGDYEKDYYVAYGPEDLEEDYTEEIFLDETIPTEETVSPEQTIPVEQMIPDEETEPEE